MTPVLAAALSIFASGADNANVCRFVSATRVDLLVFEDTAFNDSGALIASERIDPSAPSSWITASADTVRIQYRLGGDSPWVKLGRVTCAKGATLRVL